MSHHESNPFDVGEVVELMGMSDPTVNGSKATLVRPAGKDRWVATVAGKEKGVIVSRGNLQKLQTPTQSYSIVGTWDCWEPHEMQWDAQLRCFAFDVAVSGADCCESFKILLEGSWDSCIYPDRADANLFDNHVLRGPDDGGLEECWTIGGHQEDLAAQGDHYTVRLFILPNGVPKSVDWVTAGHQIKKIPVQEPGVKANRVPPEAPEANLAPTGPPGPSEEEVTLGTRPPLPAVVPVVQPVGGARGSVQWWTGNRERDERFRRVEESCALQAAEIAMASARQTDVEGCFEVMHTRVAVRAGPAIQALTLAAAKAGQVIRGIPHEVDGKLWLQLDHLALRRLGATSYMDPGDQPEHGWVLIDAQHLGLGQLLRRTSKPEMADEFGVFTRDEAKKKWEAFMKKDRHNAKGRSVCHVEAIERAEAKAEEEVHPGRTHCTVCGYRAFYARDKNAHVRATGHDGFWMCPT
uniref:Uncharacterized protein n=1 Tax=Pyrodinium bahamense TaxID=73915 RepID=A0A7S0ABK3_9DINO